MKGLVVCTTTTTSLFVVDTGKKTLGQARHKANAAVNILLATPNLMIACLLPTD